VSVHLLVFAIVALVCSADSVGAAIVEGGGTFGDGDAPHIEVYVEATSGEIPLPAGGVGAATRLPSPVFYEWMAASGGEGAGGLQHLCRVEDGSPVGVPNGWWFELVVTARSSGVVVSRESVCVPLPDPGDPSVPPAPPVPVPPTVGEVWAAARLPRPELGVSPPEWGVTGFETWVWWARPSEVAVAAELDGFRVEGTARLVGWWMQWGEGPPVWVTEPGTAALPAARHTYETKGVYDLELVAVWAGEVTMTGPGLAAPVVADIGYAFVRTAREYRLREVVPRLVG
jgi:hypothetical protein